MEITCKNNRCNAPLLKSYGMTTRLRSKSIRWDGPNASAILQCNMCRSFQEVPLELKIQSDKVILEVATEIKKSVKEKLVVPAENIKAGEKQR